MERYPTIFPHEREVEEINVENDDATFVAEIYYKKLIENGARSNLARLVANDPSVRDRLGAGGVPKLHSWPEGQVRSKVRSATTKAVPGRGLNLDVSGEEE